MGEVHLGTVQLDTLELIENLHLKYVQLSNAQVKVFFAASNLMIIEERLGAELNGFEKLFDKS